MPTNTVDDVLSDLQKFYSKKLTDTQVDFYTTQMGSMNEDDLCQGAIALKRKERVFPVIATLWQYATEAREIRLQREKERAPTFSDLAQNNQTTPNGTEAIAMMRGLYEGRTTRERYLASMFKMEEKYPGIGWKENAEELQQFWSTEAERHAKGERILERQRKGRGW